MILWPGERAKKVKAETVTKGSTPEKRTTTELIRRTKRKQWRKEGRADTPIQGGPLSRLRRNKGGGSISSRKKKKGRNDAVKDEKESAFSPVRK